jgi:hypothetical protein
MLAEEQFRHWDKCELGALAKDGGGWTTLPRGTGVCSSTLETRGGAASLRFVKGCGF